MHIQVCIGSLPKCPIKPDIWPHNADSNPGKYRSLPKIPRAPSHESHSLEVDLNPIGFSKGGRPGEAWKFEPSLRPRNLNPSPLPCWIFFWGGGAFLARPRNVIDKGLEFSPFPWSTQNRGQGDSRIASLACLSGRSRWMAMARSCCGPPIWRSRSFHLESD